jgi:phosphatidylinositol dimannoside acyltransferase
MSYTDSTPQTIGTAMVLALSQGLPVPIGRPVASFISFLLGNRVFSPTFRAICLNQWVVHGENLKQRELHKVVCQVYQNQGRALYDFYHNLDRPHELCRMTTLTPRFQTLMDECMSGKRKQGTLMLMPHLSGFNLSGLAVAQQGFKFLTLALPNPNRGYVWQNQLRNERGMEVLPMTIETMQLARQRLQAGGTVLTGVDRPIENSDYKPLFFGKPATLPVAYVKLALRTGARVVVLGFQTLKDHSYIVDASPQIELVRIPDPHEELVLNAQRVLKIIEQFILLDPSQWMMFLPVWPEIQKEIPLL